MKATKLAAVLAAGVLILAACGDDDGDDGGGAAETTAAPAETTAAQAEGDCASEDFFCIGLVTDVGKVDDKSFNQSAWEGAQQAASELGGKAEFIETKDSKDYAANIDQFIQNDYDAIITVGFALGEATVAAATANPETIFVGVDQFQGEEVANVTGLIFNEDKAGFLAGALAGLLTDSGTIAQVLGTNLVPPVVAFGEGFEGGVAYTNPDADVLTTYHPGGLDKAFTDPEWGATTARQALDQGADVVFGAGGQTGNGALIEVAKDAPAFCIGVDTDQYETLPDARPCLVTSAMKLITPGVVELMKQAADGTIAPGNFVGDVGLAPFHDREADVPADVAAQIEELTPKVVSGEIPTGYTPGG
jgi:basic membrane protein A and related proteins